MSSIQKHTVFVFILSHPLEFILHIFPQEMLYAYNTQIFKLKIIHRRLHFQLCNLLAILYPLWVASHCWHLSVFSVVNGKLFMADISLHTMACAWLLNPILGSMHGTVPISNDILPSSIDYVSSAVNCQVLIFII